MSDVSFADLRKEFTPAQASAPVCLDGALLAEIEQAEAELEQKRSDDNSLGGSERRELAERIKDLQEQAQAKEREFTFRSIGNRRWADLKSEHPPSAKDRQEGSEFDFKGFMHAAIVESVVSPKLTLDDVDWLDEHLSEGQFRRIWTACLAANVGVNGPKAQPSDTVQALLSEPKSTSRPRPVSLGPSSSVAS